MVTSPSTHVHLQREMLLKGNLKQPEDCKSLFSNQAKLLYLAFFFQESNFTGPKVKQHSESIHRGMCPARDFVATIFPTSYIA